jgi:dolichol-phosphate mannosyltransferase
MPGKQTDGAAPQLSIVIPVFNEYGNVGPLIEEIERALSTRLRFEIVVVDDGSTDGTATELAEISRTNHRFRLRVHGRNRGQSAAIRTGVKAASAEIVAVLDGDGQNDPADIPQLFATINLSPDIRMVVGERLRRKDNWIRLISSRIANAARSKLLGDGIRDTGCGLKVFYREDFLDLPAFDHMHRFLPALMQRRGGLIHTIPVNHRRRRRGLSKYGINNRLWVGIVDLFGVMWLKSRGI